MLCVGGAGAKADPTRLRFADIKESSVDPLARAVRHRSFGGLFSSSWGWGGGPVCHVFYLSFGNNGIQQQAQPTIRSLGVGVCLQVIDKVHGHMHQSMLDNELRVASG